MNWISNHYISVDLERTLTYGRRTIHGDWWGKNTQTLLINPFMRVTNYRTRHLTNSQRVIMLCCVMFTFPKPIWDLGHTPKTHNKRKLSMEAFHVWGEQDKEVEYLQDFVGL